MSKKIALLIVDDHRLVREGLKSMLSQVADVAIVGEAADGRAAIQRAKELAPDIILMDISMPLLNGLEATRLLLRENPSARVIALSVHEDEEMIRSMLAAGAMGYITKDSTPEELILAIQTVHKGEMALSSSLTRMVVSDYLRWADVRSESPSVLTPREREVIQLIAEGHKNSDIAEILSISIKTVRVHRGNIMRKLDLQTQGDLIRYAIQKKIIHPGR